MSSSSPVSLPFSVWLGSKIWKLAIGFILRDDGTFNRGLADLLDRRLPASDKPLNGTVTKDVTIDKEKNLWVRIFSPLVEPGTTGKLPVIIHFHGGFFAFLTPASSNYDAFCRKMSRDCNAVVVSVNYRRIPEHRYPAAIDDGLAAIKWVQYDGYQYLPSAADLSNSFLLGDSAGGNLVHYVSCKAAAADDLSPIVLRGQILVQPSFSSTEPTPAESRLADAPFSHPRLSDWRWKTYLPDGADRDHPACNFSTPGALDISSLNIPRSLVIIGGYCTGQDRHARYVEWLQAAGKEVQSKFYADAVHGFYLFPKYDLSLEFHADVREFIEASCVY